MVNPARCYLKTSSRRLKYSIWGFKTNHIMMPVSSFHRQFIICFCVASCLSSTAIWLQNLTNDAWTTTTPHSPLDHSITSIVLLLWSNYSTCAVTPGRRLAALLLGPKKKKKPHKITIKYFGHPSWYEVCSIYEEDRYATEALTQFISNIA